MISNRFGATVGVVSIDAGVGVGAGGGACSCGGAADKHKLIIRCESRLLYYITVKYMYAWDVAMQLALAFLQL